MKPIRIGLLSSLAMFATLSANVALSEVFSEGCVLQRDREVSIFGTADEGETVTIRFRGKTVTTVAKGGRFRARIPSGPAGTGFELKVTGKNEITLTKVQVGEVWIAGGQSNMEWFLRNDMDSNRAILSATNPLIRILQVPRRLHAKWDPKPMPAWVVADATSVSNFSAVGWYFANRLQAELGVPVGVINCNYGGTPAEGWMSYEAVATHPDPLVSGIVQRYESQWTKDPEGYAKRYLEYEARLAVAKTNRKLPTPKAPMGPESQYRPAGMYEMNLVRILPYSVRGAIWYQGENNAGRAWQYRTLLPAMISNWRSGFENPDLSFLVVQLANFAGGNPQSVSWAELREAQQVAVAASAPAALVTAIDVGLSNDVHPRDKRPVGERLALAALATSYGKKVHWQAPTPLHIRYAGGAAMIAFKEGVSAPRGEITDFELAQGDGSFVKAKAELVNGGLVLRAESVDSPDAVRYLWRSWVTPSLYDASGLPVLPFRTDDRPYTTLSNVF